MAIVHVIDCPSLMVPAGACGCVVEDLVDPVPRPIATIDLPNGETVVSMTVFEGELYVATQSRVYRKDGGRLVPLVWAAS